MNSPEHTNEYNQLRMKFQTKRKKKYIKLNKQMELLEALKIGSSLFIPSLTQKCSLFISQTFVIIIF